MLTGLTSALLECGDDEEGSRALLRWLVATAGAEEACWLAPEAGGVRELATVVCEGASTLDREALAALASRALGIEGGPSPAGAPALAERLVLHPLRGADGASFTCVALRLPRPLRAPREEVARVVGAACELAAPILRRALARHELRADEARRTRACGGDEAFREIVTADPAMLSLFGQIARVAAARAPVLVHGPTGAGKELVARALHRKSPRHDGPFVTLHCSAIPAALLESELFGSVAGAFTGASRNRPGRVAAAHGGTLFLDEIGELPLEVQAKLLRFVQFGEMQRVGSDDVQRVDVRIVSATHRDLGELVRRGQFREDLLYRLDVVTLELPALRERPGDISLLARHFLAQQPPHPAGARRFSPRAEQLLHRHPYPGNVRELAHIVERACLLSTGPVLDVDDLPPDLRDPHGAGGLPRPELSATSLQSARDEAVAATERAFLLALLDRAGGNVSRAAREANMHRSYLQKLLAKHRGALPGAR